MSVSSTVHAPLVPGAVRGIQSTRRYAMGLSVFLATIGLHLDRRDKRDVDRYFDTMKMIARKEAVVNSQRGVKEEGKIEGLVAVSVFSF